MKLLDNLLFNTGYLIVKEPPQEVGEANEIPQGLEENVGIIHRILEPNDNKLAKGDLILFTKVVMAVGMGEFAIVREQDIVGKIKTEDEKS